VFIVFEGIDGSGKTTQADMLYEYLSEKYRCIKTKEPTNSKIGRLVKDILNKSQNVDPATIQLLFTADRAQHVEKEIIPAVNEGKIVIEDRYIMSTLAYGIAAGVSEKGLKMMNSQMPAPNIIFLINIKPETAMSRLNTARIHLDAFEKIEFLKKVTREYMRLAKKAKNCFIIDGSKSKEEINKEIIRIVEAHMK
jgi:dTMP kinase